MVDSLAGSSGSELHWWLSAAYLSDNSAELVLNRHSTYMQRRLEDFGTAGVPSSQMIFVRSRIFLHFEAGELGCRKLLSK